MLPVRLLANYAYTRRATRDHRRGLALLFANAPLGFAAILGVLARVAS